jgi:ribose 5-phosphate isomerase B
MNSQNHSVIHLATDHAGFEYKNAVKDWLQENGLEVVDHGAHHFDDQDDFPDHIAKAARAVSLNPAKAKAIIFGGSGQGEAMAANRFPHVRATVYYGGNKAIVTLSREHNDANVLSFGARFVSLEEVKEMITLWLETPALEDEKYVRRNQKIERAANMH